MVEIEEQSPENPEDQDKDAAGASADNKEPLESHAWLNTTTPDIEKGVSQGFKKRGWRPREGSRGGIVSERSNDKPEETTRHDSDVIDTSEPQPNEDASICEPGLCPNDDSEKDGGTRTSVEGSIDGPSSHHVPDAASAHHSSDHQEEIASARTGTDRDDSNLQQDNAAPHGQPTPDPDAESPEDPPESKQTSNVSSIWPGSKQFFSQFGARAPGAQLHAEMHLEAERSGKVFAANRDINVSFAEPNSNDLPHIRTAELMTSHSEGDIARVLEPDLSDLCSVLRQRRMLTLACSDDYSAFDLACAIASNSHLDDFPRKRVFSIAQQNDALIDKSRRTVSSGEEPERNEESAVTVGLLAEVDQPELSKCVLLIEIYSEFDLSWPRSPGQMNNISKWLQDNNRILIFCLGGPSKNTIVKKISRDHYVVKEIDPIPYMIARFCPTVKNINGYADRIKDKMNGVSSLVTEAARLSALETVLRKFDNAEGEEFWSLLEHQINGWQSNGINVDLLMEDLEADREGMITRFLLLIGVNFPQLEPAQFVSLAGEILKAVDQEDESQRIIHKVATDEDTGKLDIPISCLQLWQQGQAKFIRRAGLVVRASEDRRSVAFSNPVFGVECRNFFQDNYFYLSEFFGLLSISNAIFSVSQNVADHLVRLYAFVAANDPDEFKRKHVHYLITHCIETEGTPNFRHCVGRFALILRALANTRSSFGLSAYIRDQIISTHEAYSLAFSIAVKLSFDSNFDSLVWLRRLMARRGTRKSLGAAVARHLAMRIARHPDGPYATFAGLARWLPDDLQTKDPLTRDQEFALDFLATRALQICSAWADRDSERQIDLDLFRVFADERDKGGEVLQWICWAVSYPNDTRRRNHQSINVFPPEMGVSGPLAEGDLAFVVPAWLHLLEGKKDSLDFYLCSDELRSRISRIIYSILDENRINSLMITLSIYIDYFHSCLLQTGIVGSDRDLLRGLWMQMRELKRELKEQKRTQQTEATKQDTSPEEVC